MSWYDLPSPSLPTSGCLQPLPPPLCSNSKAYLHNLCNCVMPTLRLTTDQYQTHSDLVPMPRATIYIPFLHLSYLPDPFSLTIMGNYSSLFNSFLHVTHPLYIARLEQNEKTAFFSFLLRHPAGIYPLECPFHRYVGALQVLGHSTFPVSDMP